MLKDMFWKRHTVFLSSLVLDDQSQWRFLTCLGVGLVVSQDVVQIVLRLGSEPVYRAAIFAGSMVVFSQMVATVSSVM